LQVNRRHPERRIQQSRDGMRRAAVEIRESVISIAVTAACLAAALTLTRARLDAVDAAGLRSLWALLSVLGMLAVTTFLFDGWFYWMHRLLHTKRFWRFHRDHHKAVAPTVWSSDSQSVVETFLTQMFLIVLRSLLPVPALTLVLHRVVDHINSQFRPCRLRVFRRPGRALRRRRCSARCFTIATMSGSP
jgi:lathosterol oxidase